MKCKNCEAIFGSHYKACPNCGAKEIKREEFAPQIQEAEEEVEVVTPYAVNGDLDDMSLQ